MSIAEILKGHFHVLDTETTGLDQRAEIVSIAIVDPNGQPLLNTLVKPTRPIPPDATRIHGITNEAVADAPSWAEVYVQVKQIISGHPLIIYNSEYDIALLHQSTFRAKVAPINWVNLPSDIACAMLAYAEYWGEWNDYYESYRWQKLAVACHQQGIEVVGAHGALADCLMTLALCRKVWGEKEPDHADDTQ